MPENQQPLPEKIIFINGLTNEVRNEERFEDVPDSIRFAVNSEGKVEPVVKIVDVTTDKQRTIEQLGRNDVVLKTTVQFRQE